LWLYVAFSANLNIWRGVTFDGAGGTIDAQLGTLHLLPFASVTVGTLKSRTLIIDIQSGAILTIVTAWQPSLPTVLGGAGNLTLGSTAVTSITNTNNPPSLANGLQAVNYGMNMEF
jgi:hypothetical protein